MNSSIVIQKPAGSPQQLILLFHGVGSNARDMESESLFALPEKPALPLQQRLRRSVGAQLPSSRELAQTLGLSRSTVTAAQQHLGHGFIESRPRRAGLGLA